ncbi:hypothetical protein EON79_04650 [bacterium]|nr:MAG: hypothetical protein EON79_04650 [bacterium]
MNRSSVQPLVYLTLRSVVNGIKRNFSSARRLIGLLFGLGYYVFVFIRPFDRSGRGTGDLSKVLGKGKLPDLGTFEPYVFLGFAALALMLSLGILGYRGVFRPADVDVLFPTPVNPKVVLVFRIVRDYLVTLLLPLFFLVIGWRGTMPGLQGILNNYPKYGAYALRAAGGSWLLMALTWVAIGYAASLFVNRTDLQSGRNRKIIIGLIIAPALILSVYMAVQMRQAPTLETFRAVLQNPLGRFLFPTATAASAITMAPLTGNILGGVAGALFLLATSGVFLWLATTQAGWMYDQAAARGFDDINLKALSRKGDMAGVHAEQARRGKLKAGRLATRLSKWRVQGPWALMWKEAVLQTRTSLAVVYMFTLTACGMMGLMWWANLKEGREVTPNMAMFWTFGALFSFLIIQINAQTGFVEVLRRVDLQKPLPFSPAVIVAGEVAGKALITLLFVIPYALVTVILQPSLWLHGLMAIPFLFSVSLVLSASALLITILFPDIEDPTQRGFRGMMQMLATLITVSPGAAIFVAILVFTKLPLGALLAIPVNLLITAVISWGAGRLYATFNPSE